LKDVGERQQHQRRPAQFGQPAGPIHLRGVTQVTSDGNVGNELGGGKVENLYADTRRRGSGEGKGRVCPRRGPEPGCNSTATTSAPTRNWPPSARQWTTA